MNVLSLKNGFKISFMSSSSNYFREEVYTKYSIMKFENKLFLIFKGRYINGEQLFSINKIKDIYSQIIEEDIKIKIPNEINIGYSLAGTYDNEFFFNFENIILIKEEIVKDEEINDCKERGII